jgi:hypothetical protein
MPGSAGSYLGDLAEDESPKKPAGGDNERRDHDARRSPATPSLWAIRRLRTATGEAQMER